MIEIEECAVIQILYKQGYSKKAIAKQLGMSINTVRKYLKSGKEPEYLKRSGKPLKLDPYKAYIVKRLKDATPHWIPASVIFREIKGFGYPGGYTQLKDYMHSLKSIKPEAIIRFETEPGYQMQVDWAVFRRGKDRLSAFIATLGFSRAAYVEFVTDEKLETLIRCHQNAFDYFGGVPLTILYDNMKTVIIERNGYSPGEHRFQRGFWDFAKHSGFTPKVCQPYRPQTKGKVERFIHYLKHSFYYPLLGQLKAVGMPVDKETANVFVLTWLNEIANRRIHATTGEVPFERLKTEQISLQKQVVSYFAPIISVSEEKHCIAFDSLETSDFQHELSIYEQLANNHEVAA